MSETMTKDIEAIEVEELETAETTPIEAEALEASEEDTEVEETEEAEVLTMSVNEVVDEVLKAAGLNQYSPYAIHTVVNAVFETLGVDKTVRPQMMYNYSRNGLIVKGSKRSGSGVVYTADEVREFITKFVTRQINR